MTDDRAPGAAPPHGSPADPWATAGDALAPLFDAGAPFELRFALRDGEAAVRALAPRDPVAARHAEPADVAAAWSDAHRCGAATGLLLAGAPPRDPVAARAVLAAATERHAALRLQHLAAQASALAHDLLETLTHRLRTDVSTLQAVGEGALAGAFEAGEAEDVAREVRGVGEESQRLLTATRDVMSVLEPEAPRRPEPLLEGLRDAFGATGAPIATDDGEHAMALIGGPGWAACARVLAEALRHDPRLGGGRAGVAIAAHRYGWRVIAGAPGDDAGPAPWTQQQLGPLAHAGRLVAAAGGTVAARRIDQDRLRVLWSIPAAPSA
jgi:hypothetical protein